MLGRSLPDAGVRLQIRVLVEADGAVLTGLWRRVRPSGDVWVVLAAVGTAGAVAAAPVSAAPVTAVADVHSDHEARKQDPDPVSRKELDHCRHLAIPGKRPCCLECGPVPLPGMG